LTKQYLKVNKINNTVEDKYNREEFTKLVHQLYSEFDIYLGIKQLPYGQDKFKYVDKFIEWYNQYYFLSGKHSHTLVYKDDDYHIIRKELQEKPQNCAFAKILKRNKNTYEVSYITPEWIFSNYEDMGIVYYRHYSYYEPNTYTSWAHKKHHTYKKPRFAGVRNKHHFERYYAELADDKYWKSIGAPLPRRMDGTLKTRNCWEDWEDEVVSTKGNWKHSTKCKHQWEPKQKRLAKRKNITDVSFITKPEQDADDSLVEY